MYNVTIFKTKKTRIPYHNKYTAQPYLHISQQYSQYIIDWCLYIVYIYCIYIYTEYILYIYIYVYWTTLKPPPLKTVYIPHLKAGFWWSAFEEHAWKTAINLRVYLRDNKAWRSGQNGEKVYRISKTCQTWRCPGSLNRWVWVWPRSDCCPEEIPDMHKYE